MNFLQLVDRLRDESGASGRPLTTVQNLTGEMNRLKNWIVESWVSIQNAHNTWEFLRVSSVHQIEQYASLLYTNEYQAKTVDDYLPGTFRIAKAAEGLSKAQPVPFVPWDIWQQYHQQDISNYGPPSAITVRPSDRALFISPGADQDYNLWYDYRIKPQRLVLDTDEPMVDEQHHMAIVYAALRRYGRWNDAPEIDKAARRDYTVALNAMERDYLPQVTQGYWGQ